MTPRAKKAHNYLANQAIQFTQENIEEKPKNQRKAERRRRREQKRLNELNEKTSKVKRRKENTGEFSFY